MRIMTIILLIDYFQNRSLDMRYARIGRHPSQLPIKIIVNLGLD